jgi:hypothetical protein
MFVETAFYVEILRGAPQKPSMITDCLIYVSKFSIEVFLSKFIPMKLKLFWSGELYKI